MVKESKPYKMIFQVNWMLWGLLLSSQFFFIVMSWPILHMDKMLNGLGTENKESFNPAVYLSLSLGLALLSFYFHRRAYNKNHITEIDAQVMVDSFKRFQMSNMFSWAIAEFITLIGILSLLFNAPHWVMFSLCLTGFSLQAFYYPRVAQFFEPFNTEQK